MKLFVLFCRIKNETPMLLIQRYNGFCQGIRNNRLGSITEEEEEEEEEETVGRKVPRSRKKRETLYSRHSLDSTTDYASDDEEEDKYNGNISRFQDQMIGKLNQAHFQRKVQSTLRSKHRFTKTAHEKWPYSSAVHIRNIDNFLLHKPMTFARTKNEIIEYGLNSESEGFQTLSEESEVCESEEFLSEKNIQVQMYPQLTPSKTNSTSRIPKSRKFQDLPNDIDFFQEPNDSSFKSINQTEKSIDDFPRLSENDKDIHIKSFSTNLTGNARKVKDNDITSGSDLTDDNFYKTFLPSSLAENESITKINPIAILYVNQNEEEKPLDDEGLENESMKTEGQQKENMEAEFVYSVEEFPHPPDHFFDFDSFSISSISLVTGNDEEKRESKPSLSMPEDEQIYQSSGHITFVMNNRNNEESVDSSSDCFSEFARQSSRESDLISDSVSTEFTFEVHPSEQHSIRTISMATWKIMPNLDSSDSGFMDTCMTSKPGMLVELNKDEEKTRQDPGDVEDIHTKQISDTILQSILSLKKNCPRIGSKMNHQDNLLPQCETNLQTNLPLNNQRSFDITSNKNFNQTLKKRECSIKTNGRYLPNESHYKQESVDTGSALSENQNSKSVFCLDHFQGDQSTKDRLTAVQNMIQRAITIDKVGYASTDKSCQNRGRQWISNPGSETVRTVETWYRKASRYKK